MMAELKPCPFCGGDVFMTSKYITPTSNTTECKCLRCSMEFSYEQTFVKTLSGNTINNVPFEDLWNRRVGAE